jgi:hypothetical protein
LPVYRKHLARACMALYRRSRTAGNRLRGKNLVIGWRGR